MFFLCSDVDGDSRLLKYYHNQPGEPTIEPYAVASGEAGPTALVRCSDPKLLWLQWSRRLFASNDGGQQWKHVGDLPKGASPSGIRSHNSFLEKGFCAYGEFVIFAMVDAKDARASESGLHDLEASRCSLNNGCSQSYFAGGALAWRSLDRESVLLVPETGNEAVVFDSLHLKPSEGKFYVPFQGKGEWGDVLEIGTQFFVRLKY